MLPSPLCSLVDRSKFAMLTAYERLFSTTPRVQLWVELCASAILIVSLMISVRHCRCIHLLEDTNVGAHAAARFVS